jgi:uncharacterized membrane protein YsdA (DUF1294 family)
MVFAILIVLNLWTFGLFGFDKRASHKGNSRISERTLLSLAFLGGAIGGVIGTYIFRHKTKKSPFRWLLLLALFSNFAIGLSFYLIETNA